MRKTVYILLVMLFVAVMPATACKTDKKVPAGLSVEQEQRFTYYFYAAEESLRQQKYPEAFLQLNMCLAIDSTDGKTHDLLGLIYEALRQRDVAFGHFRRAYEAEPLDLWQNYATYLMREEKAKSRREAIDIVENVVKNRPKESETWDVLRDMYAVDGQYSKAIRAQNKIDALRGYDAYSALNRYRIYVMWEKPKDAIKAVNRYLEDDPTNMQFVLFRIELYEHVGTKWSVLEKAYQEALSLQPQNVLVLNNYAYGICTYGGDLKKAERMSEMAIRQEPNNATYLDTYAWVLHLQGQDVLASFYIRKALDLATDRDKTIIKVHYDAICK